MLYCIILYTELVKFTPPPAEKLFTKCMWILFVRWYAVTGQTNKFPLVIHVSPNSKTTEVPRAVVTTDNFDTLLLLVFHSYYNKVLTLK